MSLAPITAAICDHIESLAYLQKLKDLNDNVKSDYADIFTPIPHVDEMPKEVTCIIKLKEANKSIVTRSYTSPKKFKDAWSTLISQHLDASHIWPSSSQHASPALLIPKTDKTALPRWVNDYRDLNANTVTDSHPLPCVDDVISDAAKGSFWSKIDMTDAFFHTTMDPASIPLTAVTTPLGLYEWTVMPQGLKNSPAVHQRRVTTALHDFIGNFCHVYLDDIIIWSDSLEEHMAHVKLIMDTM